MGRHRGARAGARLQGAPRLHHAHLRCGGVGARSDRGQAKPEAGGRINYFADAKPPVFCADKSARSPIAFTQPAISRGRFCCAPVLPKRMPATMPALLVSISIEGLPTAANAPISAAGTVPVA